MHLKLENFDGPLDLLLYLIKTQDINVFDIPIVNITMQFLGFIREAGELDIQLAGDYLAMAAQLIEIKTNSLLPILQDKPLTAESLEDISDADPRKPLVEQLLEYEAYKKASETLAQKSALFADVYPSSEFKRRAEEWDAFERPIKGNQFDLAIVFEKILLQYSHIKTLPKVVVQTQKITIEQKMDDIRQTLGGTTVPIALKALILKCDSRYELIVLLMALLELCQRRQLVLMQSDQFEDIYLTAGIQFVEELIPQQSIDSVNID